MNLTIFCIIVFSSLGIYESNENLGVYLAM